MTYDDLKLLLAIWAKFGWDALPKFDQTKLERLGFHH